jgi:enoyl-CoA hydratase/carnithine racemase
MAVTSTDLENGIRLIQFSAESTTQSFSREFLPQVTQAIDAALTHPNVRALVLTGEGKFFSAGADIHSFAQSIKDKEAPQLIRELTGILHPLLIRMRQSPTITIAALNGASAGGGLTSSNNGCILRWHGALTGWWHDMASSSTRRRTGLSTILLRK